MIRLAEHQDVFSLVEFSRECYYSMGFDGFGYKMEPSAAWRNYHKGIDDPNILVAAYFDHGTVVGMIVCMVSDKSQYFDCHRTAQEIVFHASPKLSPKRQFKILNDLCAFAERRLKAYGVQSLYIGTDTRCEGVKHLLEKRGHKPMSIRMYKDLKGV